MIPSAIICVFKTCKGERYTAKSNGDTKMVVVFMMTEINYVVVGLCNDLVLTLSFLYL